MGARVLIIGAGDAGLKIAAGLAQSGKVDHLLLAGMCQGRGPGAAGLLETCSDCAVRFAELDGTRQADVEALLRREPPDLLVQSASLMSPWLALGRSDPTARALTAAGLGVQLPAQLPILLTVMRAVKAVDFRGPVANLSFPDVTHPILKALDLAPTIGLGNVSMQHLRVRAALRQAGAQRLIRLVGHHKHVYGVMTAEPPADPAQQVRVYLGEAGERADELAYQGFPLPPGIEYNVVTAASALPVLLALLPGAQPLRFSAPAPLGLPGGYPVRIANGRVELDLPPGADLDEIVEFHWTMGRGDGVARVESDGTVVFTDEAHSAVSPIDPELAAPLVPSEVIARYERLARHLNF